MQAELAPYNANELSYYTAYTVVVEAYSYNGYPDRTITVYPRIVCNQYDGCPGVYAPNSSVLEVRSAYRNSCDAGMYEGYNFGGYYDDVQSIVLEDDYGSSCGTDQVKAVVTHAYGYQEELVGYRSY